MLLLLSQGIPGLPDLTHPQELLQFGQQVLKLSKWLVLLLAAFGVVLAAVNFSWRRGPVRPAWLDNGLDRYGQLLYGVQHGLLLVAMLVGGFFLCSTLANRYHHWEQDKLAQVAGSVAGERVEQPAPQVIYTVEEPYTTITYVDGKPTEVEKRQKVERFLSPSASQVEVNLTQTTDPATLRLIYQSALSGTYQVTNRLAVTENFTFDASPPMSYSLLQDYRVEQDGQRLEPKNEGDYRFPLRLAPGESSQFRVTYKAQGAPRWVYNANGRLLSKFRLTVLADFPNADFASGIVPTEMKGEGQGTRFTWVFEDNVSVQNPFGVFTATQGVRHTGILPRLLLLAPGILLWWLLLLYLSVPLRLRDVVLAAGIFFACLLCLTYASRLFDAKLAWALLMPILLLFGWSLGQQRPSRWGAASATFSGAVLPVLGFLVPYTGLTLGMAGLLSAGWLILYNRRSADQGTVAKTSDRR
jgi:hypothetical protein